MPKTNSRIEKEKEKDRQLIATIAYYQTLKNVSDDRLSDAAMFTKRTLCNRRKHPEGFSIGELRRISHVLSIPPGELINGI